MSSEISMGNFSQLPTPQLILEEEKLRRNVSRMRDKADNTGVQLRPHAKTAKSAEIMALFNDGETTSGLTVSTLKEAEYFAENGFIDLLYAVCITPDKFPRVESLLKEGIRLTVIVDSIAVTKALAAYAEAGDVYFSVGIEIDCDGHRAGLKPEDATIVEIAQLLSDSKNVDFWGVMTHGGGSYSCSSQEELQAHAEQERRAIVQAAAVIQEHSIECDNISLGSTPTVTVAEHFDGVTEIRPGVFVFFDLFQTQQGVCNFDDIALSVLATVTSHKPESNRLFIDAGGLALSKDRSTQHQETDLGYGMVIRENGNPLEQTIIVTGVNQEHGVIDLPEEVPLSNFPIGSRVRVLTNHSCMTAAAYPGYNLIESSGNIRWVGRCNGW